MKRIFLIIILTVSLISCCGNSSKKKATTQAKSDVTEVLYFHGKKRCMTCNAIEKFTKEVVDSLANEKVIMKVIDISQKDNEVIAEKYEVTWSSLIINRNGKVENLTEMAFGYAKAQPEVFKAKLVETINKIAE